MTRLQETLARLQKRRDELLIAKGQRDLLETQLAKARTAYSDAQGKIAEFELVQILLQNTSEYARQQAKHRIEEIVTQALTIVFDNDYQFIVELDIKGNQPVAEYYLKSEDVITQLKAPDYGRGGGVIDVVALALRLAIGELTNTRGPLFLDEVGKHISQEYQPNVGYFLKQYSEQFGRQIILVTHNAHLAEVADQGINITKVNGAAKVTVI